MKNFTSFSKQLPGFEFTILSSLAVVQNQSDTLNNYRYHLPWEPLDQSDPAHLIYYDWHTCETKVKKKQPKNPKISNEVSLFLIGDFVLDITGLHLCRDAGAFKYVGIDKVFVSLTTYGG